MKVMSLRLPEELHEDLRLAATNREVALHWLIVKILAESVPRLDDPDEFKVLS